MKIIKPHDLLSILSNHNLLLDTNVFIDTLLHPTEFGKFFNELKENGISCVTLQVVLIEFMKGTLERQKFIERKKLVEKITNKYLPITKETFDNLTELVELYKEDGKNASITDLLLGGILMQYPRSLFLLTKNISDFPTNIFTLKTYMNLFHRKAIQSYGVYSFENKT